MRLVTAAALIAALLAVLPARAEQDPAYTVSGVQVDITADSAARAREKAFVEVPRTAWQRLIERLVPVTDQGKVPRLSASELDALVHDVIVEQEKSSPVRYIASFTVRFKPDAVRGALDSVGVPVVEARHAPLVVLPVYVGEHNAVLWDDPNPWRDAWARRPSEGLVPFLVPLGELADVMAVNVDQATVRDPAALNAIARRHGTADVLVAVATLSPGGAGVKVVEVETHGFGPGVPAGSTHQITGKPGESDAALFARAVAAVAGGLAESYKQKVVTHGPAAALTPPAAVVAPDAVPDAAPSGETQLTALVPLSGMQDWLGVRQRLATLPQVRNIEIVSLSRNEAALILHYVGEPAALQASLEQAGMAARLGGDGVLLIQPPGGATRSGLGQ